MMNLFIVTYEGDLTQFIVDATGNNDPETYSLTRAMEVNHYPELGGIDEEIKADINNPSMYTIQEVNMQILANKIKGTALDGVYGGLFGDTIVIHN